MNTDRSTAGATSGGKTTAHTAAATAEAAIAGIIIHGQEPQALPIRQPHSGQPRHRQLPVRRAERQLKQQHRQRKRGGKPDHQGEQHERALLERRPGQRLQRLGPGSDEVGVSVPGMVARTAARSLAMSMDGPVSSIWFWGMGVLAHEPRSTAGG